MQNDVSWIIPSCEKKKQKSNTGFFTEGKPVILVMKIAHSRAE